MVGDPAAFVDVLSWFPCRETTFRMSEMGDDALGFGASDYHSNVLDELSLNGGTASRSRLHRGQHISTKDLLTDDIGSPLNLSS